MWLFKDYGILGQNARNLNYIKGYNHSIAKKLADSKLNTKSFLEKKGVSVVPTLKVIKNHKELDEFDIESIPMPFVIKPNSGYGGKGILIIDSLDASGKFITNSKESFTKKQLTDHLKEVLDGFYSLSGSRDKVIIEKKIVLDHEIDLLGKYGLPDIRVIVFNMVPIIAMMRVPTEKSHGKANLHAGASGVGIDIATGKLKNITLKGKRVKSIPGIGDVRGIVLPKWDDILTLAVKVQKVTDLGYLGCDIVLDDVIGPMLLEMNARSGLEVQVANLAPLKDRLERIEGIFVQSIEKGVRIGKDLFSSGTEHTQQVERKKVLGEREFINITYLEKEYQFLAAIKPQNEENYMDIDFVKNVLKVEDKVIESGQLRLSIQFFGEKKQVKFNIEKLDGINISIGAYAIKGFLFDPFKYKKGELPSGGEISGKKQKNTAINKSYHEQLQKIDKQLVSIDKKLNILKHVNPYNADVEKQKFIESKGTYIPQLEYHNVTLDIDKLFDEVSKIDIPDIPMSNIYNKKKQEVIYKLNFLKSFQTRDEKGMQYYSAKIYGELNNENLTYCSKVLSEKDIIEQEEEFMNFEEIRELVKKFNHIYNIDIHFSVDKITSRFVMKGDRLIMREGALVGKRELRSIIAHEIEGHYLRKINGRKLPFTIFHQGTHGYLEIDEGIAIYNQNRFITKKDRKYFSIYERYFFLHFAHKHSYKKLLSEMEEYYNHDYERIFNYLLRIKRGMNAFSTEYCFMKDVVYVNGFLKIEEFITAGGSLKELYIGKLAIGDIDEMKNSMLIDINMSDIKTPFSL